MSLYNEKNSRFPKTIADLPIKDSLLMVDEQINTTPSTESDEIKKSSVEILNPIPRESNDAKECEISIKGNSMESKFKGFENVLFEQNEEFSNDGDVPPFEEPLDDVLFPLPKVDILPFKVEPVEVMFNYSHTYGENISQVERKFLSMVDDLFNLSNDDETFDPGGGFPDFGSFMVNYLWRRDKVMLTISIDDLQSSLHNMGNLLSLSLSN
ncbi:hypothetical protein Tco_0321733 [Tanacetum coccineum]